MKSRLAGLSIVCAAVVAGCGMFVPRPPDRPTVKQVVSLIAYAGPDYHIYISEADGSNPRQLTRQVRGLSSDKGWSYRWPTFSPDGKRLAFAGARRGPLSQLGAAAVLVSDLQSGDSTAVLESDEMATIYLYWSPDSRHLAALVQLGADLALYVFDAEGTDQAREVLVGQPLYWSWAPDGKTLAVHVGGDGQSNPKAWVGLLHLGSGGATEERFSDPPGDFRAPAWSPSGAKLAYASLGGGTSLLSVRDTAGQVTRVAASTSDVAFNWSPSGDWLAFSYGEPGVPGFYEGLEIAHPDGSARRSLSQDPLIAFYWSPESAQLAAVGVDTAARKLTWTILSVDGKTKRPLASFLPSSDFGFQLPFFDQYAQSSNVWSADSMRLVYGAQTGARTPEGAPVEQVIVVAADGLSPAAAVANGGAAVWSP